MRVRRYLVLLALVGFAGFAEAPSASAATASVTVHATINGRDVGSSSASHPVRLRPSVPALVQVRITNKSSSPVDIRRVELTGRVIGLSFFAFDTSVGLNVPAGATDTLSYSLDLTGLRGQATGLMGGAVTVFDNHGHRVAREGMISDVRGSIVSVYGLFGFALLLLTVLAILDTAVAIARHGLPANRWRRGIRALTPGIGIGLVLVFTLSAADVAVPTGPRWLEAAVGFAVLFFVLGYLTPTPADARDDEVDDDFGDEDSALTQCRAVANCGCGTARLCGRDAVRGSCPVSAAHVRGCVALRRRRLFPFRSVRTPAGEVPLRTKVARLPRRRGPRHRQRCLPRRAQSRRHRDRAP